MQADEFWRLHPVQFEACVEELNKQRKHEDGRFGLLMAVIRRICGARNADAFDFFPQWRTERRRSASSADEIRANMSTIMRYQRQGKIRHPKRK